MQNVLSARRQRILLQYVNIEREINNIEANVSDNSKEDTDTYQISIWDVMTTQNAPKFSTTLKNDFMRQVSVNNNILLTLIDNGGKERVCGVKQAKLWRLIRQITTFTSTPLQFATDFS